MKLIIVYEEHYNKHNKIRSEILLFLLFLITFCILSCQNKNFDNSLDSSISKFKTEYKNKKIEFEMSLPSLSVVSETKLIYKFYIIPKDTFIIEMCDKHSSTLIPFLKSAIVIDEYSWNANLMLYYITQESPIHLDVYAPNNYERWKMEEKEKELKFWRSYNVKEDEK